MDETLAHRIDDMIETFKHDMAGIRENVATAAARVEDAQTLQHLGAEVALYTQAALRAQLAERRFYADAESILKARYNLLHRHEDREEHYERERDESQGIGY